MADTNNKKNGSSNKIAVMRDILNTVSGVTEAAQKFAEDIGLSGDNNEHLKPPVETKLAEDFKEFLGDCWDDVTRQVRHVKGERMLEKNRQNRQAMAEKYGVDLNELKSQEKTKQKRKTKAKKSESVAVVSEKNLSVEKMEGFEYQPKSLAKLRSYDPILITRKSLNQPDTVAFPEFQAFQEVKVLLDDGTIENRTVTLPENFAGLTLKQPLTLEQLDILEAFAAFHSVNLRFQRPTTFYILKKTGETKNRLLAELQELEANINRVKQKELSLEMRQELRTCFQNRIEILNQLEKLAENEKLDNNYRKTLPPANIVLGEDVPAALRVSSYHTEALANAQCSVEQAREYRSLSEKELLESHNKLKAEEENLNTFLDYLKIIPEEQNPFNLSGEKKAKKIDQSHNEILDDEINLQAQEIPGTAEDRKKSYDYALETLTHQANRSVATAKLLCNIEMAHRHNANDAEHKAILKTDAKLDATYISARTRAESQGPLSLHPLAKEDLNRKIDSEIQKIQQRKTSIRFRLVSTVLSSKKVELRAQETKLREIKKIVDVATEKTPVIQSLLGEGILGHPQIRARFIAALQNDKYSNGIVKNVGGQVDPNKLEDLRKLLTNKKADPVLLDGKIAEFIANCNSTHLQRYFEKLIDGMIAEIKTENAKLWKIRKFLTGRDKKDEALIKHLEILKARLGGGNSLLSDADKGLDFIEIYQTPEIAPFLKSFNEEQRKNNRPSFVRLPRLEAIADFERDKSSPLYKLLKRSADYNSVNYLFRKAFLSLLGLPEIADDQAVLNILTMPDHQALDALIREMTKRLTNGIYRPPFSDPITRASFDYLVKQLMSTLRVGLTTQAIDTYERQKFVGDIKAIKQLGHFEAESPLIDLVFDHPYSIDNNAALLAEIDRVSQKLASEKGNNIQNVLKGLAILKSFVDGTRQGLLSEDEKGFLRNVLPEYRLVHTHDGIEYNNRSLEDFLVTKHIRPAYNELIKTFDERFKQKSEAVLLDAAVDFENCKSYIELIKAYALDKQFERQNWDHDNYEAIASVFPDFRNSFLRSNDIPENEIVKLSVGYLRTAFDNSANIQFHFFINAYLFGFTPALLQRLTQYGFPQIDIELPNGADAATRLSFNEEIAVFVNAQIAELTDEQVDMLLEDEERNNLSVEERREVLFNLFFIGKKIFSQDNALMVRVANDKVITSFTDLQSVFRSAVEDFNEARRRTRLEDDGISLFSENNLKIGLLIRNIGTDAQAFAYLEKRLPLLMHNDRIVAEEDDKTFLQHIGTYQSEKCQTLIAETVRVFVDQVINFPTPESDKTEEFIANFAPQYLAAYQHKRLLSLLAQLADAHREMCDLQQAEQNDYAVKIRLNSLSKLFHDYLKKACFGSGGSLLLSSSPNATILRANIAKQLQAFVDVQNDIMLAVISVQNNEQNVEFKNYLGNYTIFPVPGQGDHALLGAAVESLINFFSDETTLTEHRVHKLATLLEMSFLFDKDQHDININISERVGNDDEYRVLRNVEFNNENYSLKYITDYFETLPEDLKTEKCFATLFSNKLETHLVELENGERPLSTTAELFFRRFGTQDQCDRFRICYIKDLLARGEAMRANAHNQEDLIIIDERILKELKELLNKEPVSRANRYIPQFAASNFVKEKAHREKLDEIFQEYIDKRISHVVVQEAADEAGVVNGSVAVAYAPINTVAWKVGEELASKEQVRTTRFNLLEEYLQRSSNLSPETAEVFIQNFVSRPLDGMINSEKADELSLAYIEAMEKGNLQGYDENAQIAAEMLIAFFSPGLLHRLFYAKLAQMFKSGLYTAAKIAGGAINKVLDGLAFIVRWASAAFTNILEVLGQNLNEFLGSLINLVEAKAIQFQSWLSTQFQEWISAPSIEPLSEKLDSFRGKRNFLLDYLCQAFVNRDDTQVSPSLIEGEGLIRMLLASQTFDRADKSKPVPDASKLTKLLLGQGLQGNQNDQTVRCAINFDRFETTREELKNTFAWFCALDNEGYYSSAFALLHIAQLCQNNADAYTLNDRISNLEWMKTYQFKNQAGETQFQFLHQVEADELFKASPFFQNAALLHNVDFARIVNLYASDEVADDYRLKKVHELIEHGTIQDAEKFINELAGNYDYHEYMLTPQGKEKLRDLLDDCLDRNLNWNPVVSAFIHAFTSKLQPQNKALQQKDNLQRLDLTVAQYNQYRDIPVKDKARFARDDYEAFKEVLGSSDSTEFSKKIAELFGNGAPVIEKLANLLDQLLFNYLPLGNTYATLTEFARDQLATADSERKGLYPRFLLSELARLNNKADITDVNLGQALGMDMKKSQSIVNLEDEGAIFRHQLLNQFSTYLQNAAELKGDAFKSLAPDIQLKLQKIDLLFSAYKVQKDQYGFKNPQQHDQEIFSLYKEDSNVFGYTKTLKDQIVALNYNGGGGLEPRQRQMKAELGAQEFLRAMRARIFDELQQTLIDDLKPYETVENEGTTLGFNNYLLQIRVNIAEIKADDEKRANDRLSSCKALFLSVQNTLGKEGIRKAAEPYSHLFKLANQVATVSDQINLVSPNEPEAGQPRAAILLSELSPILMSPLFDKSYSNGPLTVEDKSHLSGFLKSYSDAMSGLLTLTDDATIGDQAVLVRQMLEAFVDIVALNMRGIDVDKLKELLNQQYPNENTVKAKYIPIEKTGSKIGVNYLLQQVFFNIQADYAARRAKGSNKPVVDLQKDIREQLARFSISQGCYRDMQQGIDTRINKTRERIFDKERDLRKFKHSVSDVVVDELKKALVWLESEYTVANLENLSYKQLVEAHELLVYSNEFNNFKAFFDNPRSWTAENITRMFTALRKIKTPELLDLIYQQFASQLGSTNYEQEKKANPHFMSYKTLLKVVDLVLVPDELPSDDDLHIALTNTITIRDIAEQERKLQTAFAQSVDFEVETLSDLITDFRNRLGIKKAANGKAIYRQPLLSEDGYRYDTRNTNEIARVFCADLLQAQFNAFSKLYSTLSLIEKRGQYYQQLAVLNNEKRGVALSQLSSFEDIAQFVISLEAGLGVALPNLRDVLREIENPIQEMRNTNKGVRAATTRVNLSETARVKEAKLVLQQFFEDKKLTIEDALEADEQKNKLEPNFIEFYQHYREISSIINQIAQDNLELQSRQLAIPESKIKLFAKRPDSKDMDENFLYLYLDDDQQLVYEYADRSNSQAFTAVVVNQKQLGLEYYHSIVTVLQEAQHENAPIPVIDEFDENTMLALSQIIPSYGYYTPDNCEGKWALVTNRVGQYDANLNLGLSVSACLSNYQAKTAEILGSTNMDAYLQGSLVKAADNEDTLDANVAFTTRLNEFKNEMNSSPAGKAAKKIAIEKELSGKNNIPGSYSNSVGSAKSQPISTPLQQGLEPDRYKGVKGADPSLASKHFNATLADTESLDQLKSTYAQNSQRPSVASFAQKPSPEIAEQIRRLQAEEEQQRREVEEEEREEAARKAIEDAKIAEENARRAAEEASRSEEERKQLEREQEERVLAELERKRLEEKREADEQERKAEEQRLRDLEEARALAEKAEQDGLLFEDFDSDREESDTEEDKDKKAKNSKEDESDYSSYDDYSSDDDDDQDDNLGKGIQSSEPDTEITIVIPASQSDSTPSQPMNAQTQSDLNDKGVVLNPSLASNATFYGKSNVLAQTTTLADVRNTFHSQSVVGSQKDQIKSETIDKVALAQEKELRERKETAEENRKLMREEFNTKKTQFELLHGELRYDELNTELTKKINDATLIQNFVLAGELTNKLNRIDELSESVDTLIDEVEASGINESYLEELDTILHELETIKNTVSQKVSVLQEVEKTGKDEKEIRKDQRSDNLKSKSLSGTLFDHSHDHSNEISLSSVQPSLQAEKPKESATVKTLFNKKSVKPVVDSNDDDDDTQFTFSDDESGNESEDERDQEKRNKKGKKSDDENSNGPKKNFSSGNHDTSSYFSKTAPALNGEGNSKENSLITKPMDSWTKKFY
ncbi:MAG: hypothetical protein HKM04_00915 [Legionellales bacterium]|nr:hypothetical protein [Legionellales bacterium]